MGSNKRVGGSVTLRVNADCRKYRFGRVAECWSEGRRRRGGGLPLQVCARELALHVSHGRLLLPEPVGHDVARPHQRHSQGRAILQVSSFILSFLIVSPVSEVLLINKSMLLPRVVKSSRFCYFFNANHFIC